MDNLTWHFSAVWVGTYAEKIGTFGPWRDFMKLLKLQNK
jgi:hypothetical protein